MTAGGDQLDHPGDPSSPTVSLLGSKLQLNSVISDAHKGARFLGLDIKNFYLGTPMKCHQCIRVLPSMIPQEIWDDPRYKIHIAADGCVYLEICQGMHGLKEAGVIAFQQLVKKLAPHRCYPSTYTPGLWKHNTRKTTFVLCADDFGVKYFSKADALHLIAAVQSSCNITIDWTGALCCGLTLEWNYAKGHIDISMPGCVVRALARFNHPAPKRPQHAPHKWTAPICRSRQQQLPTKATVLPLLDKTSNTRVQSVQGTFQHCSRACEPCITAALNEMSTEQAKPTVAMTDKCNMLMDHMHTYPNSKICFHASDMILKLSSDAACLVLPKARSCVATHMHLRWKNSDRVNGPVKVVCQTLKNVVGSATEVKTRGIYTGGQKAHPMIAALEDVGHKQPPDGTPFETDNRTAKGILCSNIRQKLSKAFNMRCWWIKDNIRQKKFNLIWAPGKTNLADYFTKHHPPWHHRKMHYKCIQRLNLVLSKILKNRPPVPTPPFGRLGMGGCVSFPVIS